MTLKAALRKKNRLSEDIERLKQIVQKHNSFLEGTPDRFDVLETMEKVSELVEELVSLKVSIHLANASQYHNICKLAELKKFVQFLDRIPTEEGPVSYLDGAAKRIVHFNGKDISEVRKSMQENIDAIQNELETFAALTQI